ncbi:MAG: hypothetical protein J7K87_01090 [Candidatus Aenigmarchaeota archaeon]|nr:hypothetical protein [Candidatus Aenigmarchaeota archaeon]
MHEAEIKDKIKKGWIKCWSMIEVMATDKKTTEQSLKNHIEKLKKEKGIIVYKEKFDSIEEVKSPFKNIEKAYSQVVEIEFIIENFKNLVDFVILYGPSTVEIMEPDKIETKIGDAQEILNRLSTLLHKFAAAGIGGMLISPK